MSRRYVAVIAVRLDDGAGVARQYLGDDEDDLAALVWREVMRLGVIYGEARVAGTVREVTERTALLSDGRAVPALAEVA